MEKKVNFDIESGCFIDTEKALLESIRYAEIGFDMSHAIRKRSGRLRDFELRGHKSADPRVREIMDRV